MSISGQERVFIMGGGSGIGFEVAASFLEAGAEVWIGGRSDERLKAAREKLVNSDQVRLATCDMTDEWSVEAAVSALPKDGIDHLIITASSSVHGPFDSLAIDQAQAMFASKFWGPYRVAKAMLPVLSDGGSITFFSGVLSRRPGMNCSGLGAVNAAVEGLTRGLALELGPKVRVNCVSPGMVRTEAYAGMPEEDREAMYRNTGESLPVGRVGTAGEIAQATVFAATNPYFTGQILDVDGGHMIRQYATR